MLHDLLIKMVALEILYILDVNLKQWHHIRLSDCVFAGNQPGFVSSFSSLTVHHIQKSSPKSGPAPPQPVTVTSLL